MVARMTWLGKVVTQNSVWLMEKVGLVPVGTYDVGEALKVAADALVAGGREKLFTPMRTFICQLLVCQSSRATQLMALLLHSAHRALRLQEARALQRLLVGACRIGLSYPLRCALRGLSAFLGSPVKGGSFEQRFLPCCTVLSPSSRETREMRRPSVSELAGPLPVCSWTPTSM
jgi:hypothetical protein